MVTRITATDPDDIMPPAKTHKVLTADQKELLKQWIADGAKYQLHWSLIAPTRPKLPQVQNHRWERNPIDAFILARLEKEGLSPAPEADRRTLARRVSFDLTGFAAGMLISFVPVLVVFLVFQRYFVRGLAGAVKE